MLNSLYIKEFTCLTCNYKTANKSNFNKHKTTKKCRSKSDKK